MRRGATLALTLFATSLTAAAQDSPSFRDCEQCPEMVAIPAGKFLMGSPVGEFGRSANENPQHEVTLPRFAVARFEVTRAEFAAFVQATLHTGSGCTIFDGFYSAFEPGATFLDPGYDQLDADPAVCVSWDEVQAYLKWLSLQSGQRYRLLTEAEWEYAARAGTSGRWYWGEEASVACTTANGRDETGTRVEPLPPLSLGMFPCDDGFAYTAPVGSLAPNAFGLHDMLGNAWEWVEDCWRGPDYSARTLPPVPCTNAERVVRGGSWYFGPRNTRAAQRHFLPAADRHFDVGFRIARDLP